MKNNKKTNPDMGLMVLTGIIAMILSFTLLMLAGIITQTDITLMETERAVPAFIGMSGLIWWYIWSNQNGKGVKSLKKA